MSVQILLQGKLSGAAGFLLSGAPEELLLTGRSHWVSLLSEVLPRALIAELGLSRILLGSSGGGQFLAVLPSEFRTQADEFLAAARAGIESMSHGRLHLLWSITENLGDWTIVRKRLNDDMQRQMDTPLASSDATFPHAQPDTDLSLQQLAVRLKDAAAVSWSPEAPAVISTGPGKHSWPLGSSADAIPFARHTALADDGHHIADAATLARRAEGRPVWGVLRGDVDNFGIRIRRVQTIEEHVQLSVLYKQFFAGELEVLCSLPEFWRKVNLIYTGGDDFALYGAWDALISFARELQRLFHRFGEEHLKDFPGPEGKTLTMALAIAPDLESTLGSVFDIAGDRLEIAKCTSKDCLSLLGRTLEWKQLADAADLKDQLARMVDEFGVPAQYLRDLCGIYRDSRRGPAPESGRGRRVERPWRFHRRLNHILGVSRNRDFQKARNALVTDLVGRNTANLKLRPSGRVALEWARLSTDPT
jgi:CRISPR-associated protein Csm1